jgi:hypothetical protein
VNKLLQFLKEHNITAHTIAGVIASAAALVVADTSFRNHVLIFFERHPDIGTELVAACGIITVYIKATKKDAPK